MTELRTQQTFGFLNRMAGTAPELVLVQTNIVGSAEVLGHKPDRVAVCELQFCDNVARTICRAFECSFGQGGKCRGKGCQVDFWPILGSVPARMREILVRWRQ